MDTGAGGHASSAHADIAKAVGKTTTAGRVAPVVAFVPGGGDVQKALPGSGQRLSVFGATIKGIIAALKRNLLYAGQRAEELKEWSDEALTACALNHTLPVESIFSHMRALEDNSHRTRAPLMANM